MNEVASVILACASSAVAGGAIGALIQSIRDEAAICRRNRIINNLYRKYQNKGLTTTRTVPIVRFDGKPDVRRETLWTMAGHRFIRDLMTKTEEV